VLTTGCSETHQQRLAELTHDMLTAKSKTTQISDILKINKITDPYEKQTIFLKIPKNRHSLRLSFYNLTNDLGLFTSRTGYHPITDLAKYKIRLSKVEIKAETILARIPSIKSLSSCYRIPEERKIKVCDGKLDNERTFWLVSSDKKAQILSTGSIGRLSASAYKLNLSQSKDKGYLFTLTQGNKITYALMSGGQLLIKGTYQKTTGYIPQIISEKAVLILNRSGRLSFIIDAKKTSEDFRYNQNPKIILQTKVSRIADGRINHIYLYDSNIVTPYQANGRQVFYFGTPSEKFIPFSDIYYVNAAKISDILNQKLANQDEKPYNFYFNWSNFVNLRRITSNNTVSNSIFSNLYDGNSSGYAIYDKTIVRYLKTGCVTSKPYSMIYAVGSHRPAPETGPQPRAANKCLRALGDASHLVYAFDPFLPRPPFAPGEYSPNTYFNEMEKLSRECKEKLRDNIYVSSFIVGDQISNSGAQEKFLYNALIGFGPEQCVLESDNELAPGMQSHAVRLMGNFPFMITKYNGYGQRVYSKVLMQPVYKVLPEKYTSIATSCSRIDVHSLSQYTKSIWHKYRQQLTQHSKTIFYSKITKEGIYVQK